MMIRSFSLCLLPLLVLSGCVSSPSRTTETTHDDGEHQAHDRSDRGWASPGVSPLEWIEVEEEGRAFLRPVLADLPSGPSKMELNAQQDALERISATEQALAELYPDRPREPALDPVVERVLYLEPGRELWVIQTERDGIAYIVEAESTVQPGAGMRIVGPYNYHKGSANQSP